jgi:hypothetical protein
MLERLLLETGDEMFPFAGETFTDQRITASVSNSGQLPGETAGGQGNHYFILANGRVELSDDHATFSPRGGQRVRVDRDEAATDAAAPAPTTMTTMTMTTTTTAGGRTVTTVRTSATAFPFGAISRGTVVMALIDGVLGLLLAVFLLIAGIFVLRDSPRGRGMHLFYAFAKIPLAALGAVASWMLYTQMMGPLATAPGTPVGAFSTAMGVTSAVWACIACIYPLALFIVMSTRTVKAYYLERRAAVGR